MAEFCKECAEKLEEEFDGYPVFCEECGEVKVHDRFTNSEVIDDLPE